MLSFRGFILYAQIHELSMLCPQNIVERQWMRSNFLRIIMAYVYMISGWHISVLYLYPMQCAEYIFFVSWQEFTKIIPNKSGNLKCFFIFWICTVLSKFIIKISKQDHGSVIRKAILQKNLSDKTYNRGMR